MQAEWRVWPWREGSLRPEGWCHTRKGGGWGWRGIFAVNSFKHLSFPYTERNSHHYCPIASLSLSIFYGVVVTENPSADKLKFPWGRLKTAAFWLLCPINLNPPGSQISHLHSVGVCVCVGVFLRVHACVCQTVFACVHIVDMRAHAHTHRVHTYTQTHGGSGPHAWLPSGSRQQIFMSPLDFHNVVTGCWCRAAGSWQRLWIPMPTNGSWAACEVN